MYYDDDGNEREGMETWVAYVTGRRDYQWGLTKRENPETADHLRRAWFRGWRDARNEDQT